ncbi:hypothetical protein STEG23_036984, partial [Scotinomys teguina]
MGEPVGASGTQVEEGVEGDQGGDTHADSQTSREAAVFGRRVRMSMGSAIILFSSGCIHDRLKSGFKKRSGPRQREAGAVHLQQTLILCEGSISSPRQRDNLQAVVGIKVIGLEPSGFYLHYAELSLALFLDILLLSCVVEILQVWVCGSCPFTCSNRSQMGVQRKGIRTFLLCYSALNNVNFDKDINLDYRCPWEMSENTVTVGVVLEHTGCILSKEKEASFDSVKSKFSCLGSFPSSSIILK